MKNYKINLIFNFTAFQTNLAIISVRQTDMVEGCYDECKAKNHLDLCRSKLFLCR